MDLELAARRKAEAVVMMEFQSKKQVLAERELTAEFDAQKKALAEAELLAAFAAQQQRRAEAEIMAAHEARKRLLAEKELLIDGGYLEQPAEARGVRNQKKLRRGAFAKPGRPSSLFCKTCPFCPLLVGGYSTAASASSFEMWWWSQGQGGKGKKGPTSEALTVGTGHTGGLQ